MNFCLAVVREFEGAAADGIRGDQSGRHESNILLNAQQGSKKVHQSVC